MNEELIANCDTDLTSITPNKIINQNHVTTSLESLALLHSNDKSKHVDYDKSLLSSDITLASDIVIDADSSHEPSVNGNDYISKQIESNIEVSSNGSNNINEFKLNNPKEYGKFRILKSYTLNNENSHHNSSEDHSYLNMNGSSDLNGVYEGIVGNEVDILSTNEQSIVQNDESVETLKGPRGRPKKKNCRNIEKTMDKANDEEKDEKPSRRRSNRLRNLEKKESIANSEETPVTNNSKDNVPSEESKKSKMVNGDLHPETLLVHGNQEKDSKLNDKKKGLKKSKVKDKSKDKEKSKKHKKSKSKHKSDKEANHTKIHKSHSSKENFALPQEPNSSKSKELLKNDDNINSIKVDSEDPNALKPEKVKSRWRRNSELENTFSPNSSCSPKNHESQDSSKNDYVLRDTTNESSNQNEPLPTYHSIEENIFLFEKKKSKGKKETKKMVCDCLLTKEERARGLMGCGEDCLNRMLLIECGSRCPLGEHCSNKCFQKKQYCKVEPFKTEKKGWGLKALESMPANTFIMEYVGEVIDPFMFHKRVEKYSKLKLEHYYFMALKSDEIIDATYKGNVTRFINHSCEPNAITQKWTVNGELRIGFFTIKSVNPGEEITFDYQFQRYGKKAQKCYCETESCRGYIGSTESANILTDGSKITKAITKTDDANEKIDQDEDDFLEDISLDEEINMLSEIGGLRNRQQILEVSRLMLRADKCHQRIQLIDIIMSTVELAYLRLFLDYHGLQIIWGWMIEADDVDLKARLLELLEVLPIPNKTMLIDSKVYQVVERWAASDSLESQQYLNINEDIGNKDNREEDKKEDKEKKESTSELVKVEKGNETPIKSEEASSPSIKTRSDTTTCSDGVAVSQPERKSVTDLSKLSGKIVIKSKSKNNNESTQTSTLNSKVKSNLTIGFLAQKLLTHWKDLKEVFRIPRLERQKRHDDEAEADRRAKEEEERRLQGLPIIHEKRSIDSKSYTIAGILGNKRRYIRSLTEREPNRKNFSTNGGGVSNTPPSKLSKEEHRKKFEYSVAQIDYEQALKKYHEQLAIYSSTISQQKQLFFSTTLQHSDNSKMVGFNDMFNQYSQEHVANPISQYPVEILPPSYSNNFNEQSNEYLGLKSENTYIEHSNLDETIYMDVDLKDLIPEYQNPLVILTDHSCYQNEKIISPYAIDNVDFRQIKFESDNYIESMEKKMFDEIYPPAGIFYVTQKGSTYFVSFPDDLSHGLNVKENITEPLPLSFTKNTPDNRLLTCGWNYSLIDGHYYYYNQRKLIKQWHPPQDSQIDNYDDQPSLDINCDISQPSTSSSPMSNKFDDNYRKKRKKQEHFRNKISQFVVKCLNPYMKKSCKRGRITNSSDFKSLARKLTHTVVGKEMKQCKHIEDLAYTESVKHKTKEYVKRYMCRFGSFYISESCREKSNSPTI